MKKRFTASNQKGISVVSLVITIIVLLIISAIVFLSSMETIEEADYSKYTSNVSDVSTAFYEKSTAVNGDKTAENNQKNIEQVYNYVAKNGKTEENFLPQNEIPTYTIIRNENQLGIQLPNMIVESGTGKRVPVTYATTKGGQIFTWPPYEYEEKFWITTNDTVENKMVTEITVGKEKFEISIDPIYGTLEKAPGSVEDDENKEDEEKPEVTPPAEEHDFSLQVQTPEYLCSEATCAAPAVYYYKCSKCDEKGTKTYTVGSPKGHNYGEYVLIKEANCTEKGITQATCNNCGSYSNKEIEINASKHHGSEIFEIKNQVTCTENGTKVYKCSSCKAELRTENIPATSHSYGEYEINKEATCAEKGIKTKKCTKCNDEVTEEIPIDTSKHYGTSDVEITKEPTCEEKGTVKYTCSTCGKTIKTEEKAALGHTYGNSEVIEEATCVKAGTKEKTCNRCEDVVTEPIAKDKNNHVGTEEEKVTKEATCTEKGILSYMCSACNEEIRNEEIPEVGHTFGEPTFNWNTDYTSATAIFTCIQNDSTKTIAASIKSEVIKENTCEESGEIKYTATVVFEEKTYIDEKIQITDPKGHTYGDPTISWSEDLEHITGEVECPCGNVHKVEGSITVEKKDPTCEEDGENKYTGSIIIGDKVYNDTQTEILPATGHKGTTEFEWADDYSSAVAIFTCECGESQRINAVVNSIISENPTCTESGKKVYTATAVFYETTYTNQKTLIIDAIGHAYGIPVFEWSEDYTTATAIRTCSHGDSTQTLDATITTEIIKESTCEVKGEMQYTASVVIDKTEHTDIKTKEIDALGHDFVVKEISDTYLVTKGTCITPAVYNYKCSRCDAIGTETYTDEKDPENHIGTEVETITKEPTCAEEGTKTYSCSECNGVIRTEDIEKVSHIYGEPKFTWTDYTSSTAKFECNNCEDSKIEVAQITYEIVKEMTCEEDGEIKYTATVVFEGNTYTDIKTEVVPAKGHKFGNPTIKFSEDYSSAIGEFVCDCGKIHTEEEHNVSQNIIRDPTCEGTGENEYTVNITFGDKIYTGTTTQVVPPKGHTGTTEFEWADDYRSAVAIFTCSCGESQILDATVNSGISENPTCTTDGQRTYTATVVFYDQVYTNKKTVIIHALGHSYTGTATFIWSEDYTTATAIVECIHKDSTKVVEATVSKSIAKESTCKEEGLIKHTAVVDLNGQKYTDVKEEIIPILTHENVELIPNVVKEANCVEGGIIEYICPGCDEIIKTEDVDALGHDYTQQLATSTYLYSAATCIQKAQYYYKCVRCTDKGTETYEYGNLSAHTYGEPTFNWAEDNKSATATFVCSVDGHEKTLNATMSSIVIVETTCETDGIREYTAKVVENDIEYSESREATIEAYNHSKTEIQNQTDVYTGDLVCLLCGKILEEGSGPKVQALYLEDNSLVFVKSMTNYHSGDTYEELKINDVYVGMDTENFHYGLKAPWSASAEIFTKVIVKDEIAPLTTAYWFNGFKNCTEFDIEKLDMSNVKNTNRMFAGCNSYGATSTIIKGIEKMNVSNVEEMNEMFYENHNIKELNLSNWNTQSLKKANNIFNYCYFLKSVNVSGWNTTNLEEARYVFANCVNLNNIEGLSSWDTTNLTTMIGMFENCRELTNLEGIANWNTQNVSDMRRVFFGMSNLMEIDLTNWTSRGTQTEMFSGCVRLGKITKGSDFILHSTAELPDLEYEYMPNVHGAWFNLAELDNEPREFYNQYGPSSIPSKAGTYVARVYYINYDNIEDAVFDPLRHVLYSTYSPDITLKNPTREGSEFLGWTGEGINKPTLSVTIPSGSTGRKRYIANWNVRYTIPKGIHRNYTGEAQELLYAGGANVGTMYYRLGEDGEWSTQIPKATNAGSYQIYYYVTASDGYEQTPILGPVSAVISKADGKIDTPPVGLELEYNSSYQELVIPGISSTGKVRYKVNDTTYWSVDVPKALQVGEYIIYYAVAESDNYKGTSTLGSVFAKINKAKGTLYIEPQPLELKCNGEYQELITEGFARYGTVYYRIGTSGNWSTSIPKAIDGGTYEIYYYVEGNSVCESSEVMGPIISTITGHAGQITQPEPLELLYNGEEQVLVTPATSSTGTVYYKIGIAGEWSTELPKATDIGSYRIYYYAAESGDYSATSQNVYVTSVINKYEVDDPEEENYSVVYNQPYVFNIGSMYIDFIFREDGSADVWLAEEEGAIIPAEYITIDGKNVTIAMDGESINATVSEGGSQLTILVPAEEDLDVELKFNLVEVEPRYIRFGQEYIGVDYNNDNAIIKQIFAEDGSVVTYVNDSSGELPAGTIEYNEYSLSGDGICCPIYPDGSKIMINGIIFAVQENVIKFGRKYSIATGEYKESVVLYEDGSCEIYENDELIGTSPAEWLTYTYNTITIPPNEFMGNSEPIIASVSRDGMQIIIDTEEGIINFGFILEGEKTAVKFDEWYVVMIQGEIQGFLVPHEDGSIEAYGPDYSYQGEMPYGIVYGENNYLNFMEIISHISTDGNTITIIPTMYECKWIKNDSPNLGDTPIICNQPYRIALTEDVYEDLIFREDGSAELWVSIEDERGMGIKIPVEDVNINENDISIKLDGNTTTFTVSESGDRLTISDDQELVLTRLIQHDIYYEKTYIYSDGENLVEGTIYKDGSAIMNYNGEITIIPAGGIIFDEHSIVVDGIEISIYPDGTKVLYNEIVLTKTDCVIKFNQPYSLSFMGEKITAKFYMDGSYDLITKDKTEYYSAGSFEYTNNKITFSGDNTSILSNWSKTLTFSSDGSKLIVDDIEQEFELGMVLESDITAIVFETPYAVIDQGTITGYMVFHENGSIDSYNADYTYNNSMENGIIYGRNNTINYGMGANGKVSSDGKNIVIVGIGEMELVESGLTLPQ